MKAKILLIEIHLEKGITKLDLELRILLVNDIESRNLGNVIEETSSPEMMEIVIEVIENKEIEDDLKGLLTAIGFGKYEIQDISEEEA